VLGNPVLAISAGLLHAAGKLGSAWGSQRRLRLVGRSFTLGDLCKDVVLSAVHRQSCRRPPALPATGCR
jgi:hypothetical protein